MKKDLWLWMLLLVAVSLFLQFYQLGERSLWEDEARIALKASSWTFKRILHYQKNALYNLILSHWIRFGKSEVWLRIPSVLFALFSLVAFYEVGKKLLSTQIALLAVTLLATSPFFLLESRQVRMDSLALFFSLVSVFFLIQYIETARTGSLVSHIGVSLMAILTHYMFFPLLLAQCLLVLLSSKDKPNLISRYVLAWLLLLILFLPSLPSFTKRLGYLMGLYLSPTTPEILSPPLGYFGKVALVYYLFTAGPTLLPWNLFWTVPAIFLPTGLLFLSLKRYAKGPLQLVPLALLLPILLLSALRNAQPRYCFISLPFYTLLLSAALFTLRRPLRFLIFCCLLTVNAYGLFNYFAGRQYLFIAYLEPYRQIVQSVQERVKAGDFLLHTQENPSFRYYFFKRFKGSTPQGELHQVDQKGRIRMASWEELKNKFPPHLKRLWYIERPPGQYIEATPLSDAEKIYGENLAFRSWLDERFVLLDRKAYLKDVEASKKRKILPKFYLEERIVVSLYDLKDTL